MTVYAWSTITTAQGLGFTSGDQIVFDTGGNATQVQVAIGAAVTNLTFGGKTIPIQNAALLGANDDFLFVDGSRLGVNANAGADVFTASAVADHYVAVVAQGGVEQTNAETIDFLDGNDIAILGGGGDTAIGGLGDDALNGNLGADTLLGQAGNDTLFGGQGNDYIGLTGGLVANADEEGNDSLNGNLGSDTVAGSGGNDSLYGGQNDDSLHGGSGNDSLSGDLNDDTVNGDTGNDSAFGGFGNDVITGGAGNDSVNGNSGNDNVDGGAGNDTVYAGQGEDTLTNSGAATDSGDWMSGDLGNDNISGNIGADTLFGGDGNDTLVSGVTAGFTAGGAGVSAATGNDSMNGNAGNDSLAGGAGRETMFGGQGNDTLTGGDANDSLAGDIGNDTLVGGAGIDSVTGGAGNDTLGYASGDAAASNLTTGSGGTAQTSFETIVAFTGGQDKIDVAATGSYNELTTVYADYAAAAQAAAGAYSVGAVVAAQVGSDIYLFVDSSNSGATGFTINGTASGYEDVIKLTGVNYGGIGPTDVM